MVTLSVFVLVRILLFKPSIISNYTDSRPADYGDCESPYLYSDVQKSFSIKTQWSKNMTFELEELYNRANRGQSRGRGGPEIIQPPGRDRLDALGPIGPKCSKPLEKFGDGDDEKRACGLKSRALGDCIIFSFGSNNQWGFEESIINQTNCLIHTFDCTLTSGFHPPDYIKARVKTYPICVGSDDITTNGKQYLKWSSIIKLTKLSRAPTFLKMDVEGFEWDILKEIVSGPSFKPLQISFELHYFSYTGVSWNNRLKSAGEIMTFFDYLYREGGYQLIDRNDNPMCQECTELLISKICSSNGYNDIPHSYDTSLNSLKLYMEGHYRKLCGDNLHARLFTNSFTLQNLTETVSDEAAIIGLEAWTSDTVNEIGIDSGLWDEHAANFFRNPVVDVHRYSIRNSNYNIHNWPKLFISINPDQSRSDQTLRQKNQVKHMGFKDYTAIQLTANDVLSMKRKVQTHFLRDVSKLHSVVPHDLATYSAFKFFFDFNISNSAEALYLESDATPVYRFREKFDLFLTQLRKHRPNYHLAFLGTCLGLHKSAQKLPYVQLSSNVFLLNSTRCFNAVLVSAVGKELILNAKAKITDFVSIDFYFNELIKILKLDVVHAMSPLFFEESKAFARRFC